MSPTAWALLAVLAGCVALSGFFSAAETAFMSASRVRLKTMQQHGNQRAGLALSLTEDGDRLLSAILVGNNLVNIGGTAIATVLFTLWLGDMGATASTAVMTLLVLFLGEVTPKTLARQAPERFACRAARPMRAVVAVLTPVCRLFSLWTDRLGRRAKAAEEDEPDIEAELITMVDEAQQEGDMDAHEGSLIRSAIEFVDQSVKEIMTPRVDVTALSDDQSMEEAQTLFRESGYSRLPVYHEDMDHVVGVLNEKDFYTALHRGETDFRRVMVAPVYAPATLKVSKLLKLCQSTRTHLVVVLDEFGGMEGIVTMEDALEELVGEIYDEHDDVSEEMTQRPDGSWQVSGGMQLTDCLERLGIPDTYEADTVGGWASEILGHIPTVGASFTEAGLVCTVTGMDRRRVTQLSLTPIPQEEEHDETRKEA